MIRTETVTINDRQFTHTWSDENRYVVREGIEYADAYDPSEFGRTYAEGNVIDEEESNAEEILAILTGETE